MGRLALVTGGAGFIGSHVAERLVREGWRVRVLDNFSSGSDANVDAIGGGVEVMEADIRHPLALRRACRGVDTVFHLAASASVARSVDDPVGSHEVNVTGTLNVLQAGRDARVRRVVFSSSAAVYGNAAVSPVDEEEPVRPESPYATDKAAGEFYCRNFAQLYGIESVILRYFNVFGPRQSATSGYAAVIPLFIGAALEDRAPVILGDGSQTRDFVYVENVARANVLAATMPEASGLALNVGSGRASTVLDLLDALSLAYGERLRPEFRPARPGDIRHSLASILRARTVLGYEPTISLADGLARTMRAAMESYRPVRPAAVGRLAVAAHE